MEPRQHDCGLLVVSDLHLGEGRREETKRFSRNEDFFLDDGATQPRPGDAAIAPPERQAKRHVG